MESTAGRAEDFGHEAENDVKYRPEKDSGLMDWEAVIQVEQKHIVVA